MLGGAGVGASRIPAHIEQIGEPIRTNGVGWTARPTPAAGRVGGQAAWIQRR